MNEEQAEKVEERELDDEEADKAFAEDEQSIADRMADAESSNSPPDWAEVPQGLKMPEEGTQVAFVRIPAKWTRTPAKGDRVCILWPISETEEILAYGRCRGSAARSISELAKATIHACDGKKADWSGDLVKDGSVAKFWKEIGPKGRMMIRNYYVKTHQVTDEESLDFFSKHFVSVTVTKG